ncbi:class D beta-lactamase [Fundidesulfovibrio magnetotacticus]|uniref:class D beta-lactamase n=1 Tax=Fundidesulfovibrio magnetotacticus TaxID=2730080 RepID=UPI0015641B14|nr:class D beta-lactamase [Fundidesulfovibrio magnetotacticus]
MTERPDWASLFQERGVQGVLVLENADGSVRKVFDPARAARGFLPASTFKIPNALISLETGVVSGPDAVLRWDGVKRSAEAWNRDLTLREAFAVSCVPCFQGLARAVGSERMSWWVRELGYGNADISAGVDVFWLQGGMRVSALEQVAFLRRLKEGRLPFSARSMDMVKDVMRVEEGPGWTLRAKTGWTVGTDPGTGWWVGWLEKGGETWFFALNIDMSAMAQAPARQEIVKAALRGEGLL